MVKNKKWEKIEEWRASSMIGQSISTVRRLIPQKIHVKGAKDTIVKMEQGKCWCICNGQEQKMEKEESR